MENITHALEIDKRKGANMDEKIQQLKKEIETKRKAHREVLMKQKVNVKDTERLKVLRNRLNQTKRNVSQIQAQNRQLRLQIETVRKDSMNHNEATANKTAEMHEITKKSENLAREASNYRRNHSSHCDRILNLSCSFQKARAHDTSHFRSGSQTVKAGDRRQIRTMTVGFDKKIGEAKGSELLQMLSEKWVKKMKEQKKTNEDYFRLTKQLHNAMNNVIVQSGIKSLDKIVHEFLTSFEENQKLTNYVLRLNDQIDEVDKESKHMEEILDLDDKDQKMSENQRNSLLTSIQSRSDSTEQGYAQVNAHSQQILSHLQCLESHLIAIKGIFEGLGMKRTVDLKLGYGDDMILNINTVPEYLFELEQYLTKFLIYLESKNQKEAPAELIMLDVGQMAPKEFESTQPVTIREFLERDTITASTNEEDGNILTLDQMHERMKDILPPL